MQDDNNLNINLEERIKKKRESKNTIKFNKIKKILVFLLLLITIGITIYFMYSGYHIGRLEKSFIRNNFSINNATDSNVFENDTLSEQLKSMSSVSTTQVCADAILSKLSITKCEINKNIVIIQGNCIDKKEFMKYITGNTNSFNKEVSSYLKVTGVSTELYEIILSAMAMVITTDNDIPLKSFTIKQELVGEKLSSNQFITEYLLQFYKTGYLDQLLKLIKDNPYVDENSIIKEDFKVWAKGDYRLISNAEGIKYLLRINTVYMKNEALEKIYKLSSLNTALTCDSGHTFTYLEYEIYNLSAEELKIVEDFKYVDNTIVYDIRGTDIFGLETERVVEPLSGKVFSAVLLVPLNTEYISWIVNETQYPFSIIDVPEK